MEKKEAIIIKSYVGGHGIDVYADCEFDPSVRKYRGGRKIVTIPYSGRMLSATLDSAIADSFRYDGIDIPTKTAPKFIGVDKIPDENECNLCIVSAMYVAACKSLGIDTSRLLTIGDTVVDDSGIVIGAMNFNRN